MAYLELDELNTLIKKVDKYRELLSKNIGKVRNAGAALDQVTGSDEFTKKIIQRLGKSAQCMSLGIDLATALYDALVDEYKEAVELERKHTFSGQ